MSDKPVLFGYSIPTGGELKVIRQTLGIQQKEVAEVVDLTPRTIRHIENETTKMDVKTVRGMLAFYRTVASTE